MKKGLLTAALLTLGLGLTMKSGVGENITSWLEDTALNGSIISASVKFELGTQQDGADAAEESEEPVYIDTSAFAEAPVTDLTEPEPDDGAEGENQEDSQENEQEKQIMQTTITGGLTINNKTSYIIDTAALLSQELSLSLPSGGVHVLIIHTHGSEAYTPDGDDVYIASDTDRTQDLNYNVVRVGDELAAELESYGLNVIHDREIYDYPSYTGSYAKSAEAVTSYLQQYPEIALVIDLHRDALGSGDTVYKTMAEVQGEASAQVMLVVGTDESGLEHPAWQENMKLALNLQKAMNDKYPTLSRPILVAQQRYNQHLSTGSLIIEVGSSGNTLQEALTAIRLFAGSVGPMLAEYIE